MADLYYYEEGYIDAKYHVYVADAEIALGPYIEENYIDAHYYDDYSGVASLTCELTLRPGETVSATGTWTSEFTHTATVGRLQSVTADFTSAFSPTLTVDAFKNHTAIIESTTTFTVDAQANRSANVLLEHIANLNAQAAKTAVIDSTMATTATVSAQANHSVVSSATLTSTTTVTCLALNVQFGTVAMSVGSALWSKGYLRYERPLQLKQNVGSCEISTTTKKYGAGSLYVPGGLAYIEYYADSNNFIPTYNNDNWLIEFWINVEFLDNNGPIITFTDGTTDYWRFYYLVNQYRFDYKSAGGTIFTKNTTTAYSGSWVHVLIAQSSNNRFGIYINGSRKSSDNALSFTEPNLNGTLRIGGLVSNQFRGYIDELRFINGSDSLPYDLSQTTITVPTAPFSNTETTQFLGHYNVDFSDDVTLLKEYSAALTSTASVTAIGTNAKGAASAGLTSTVSLSANAGKLQTADATLSSTASQSTSAVKTVQAVLDLTANVSVSATVFRIKEFISNQNALFTPAISVQAQLAGVALLETQFTQSASAVKTTVISVTISSTATLSAVSVVTAGLAADLTVSATVSATVTRIQTANIALTSEATLVCEFTAFNNVAAVLSSTLTVTAAVERYRLTSSTLSTAVTLTADVERYRLTSSTLSTTVSVTATATRIQSADSALSSVVTQSTVAVKTPGIGVNITANVTVTAAPIYTAQATAPLGALFTPSMDADAQFAGFALLESQSIVTVIIGSIKQFEPRVNTGLQLPISGMINTGPFDAVIYPNDIQEQGYLLGSISFPQGYAYNAATLSIWVKRNTSSSDGTIVYSRDYSVPRDIGQIQIDGNTIRLGDFGYSGLINVNWFNAMPADTDWHHLFFKYTTQAGFYGDGYSLWVDGVSKGYRELQGNEAGIITFIAEYGCILGGDVAVAQLRVGDDTITVNDIYDYDRGYKDLGTSGRGYFNELTAPGIYATFDQPWSNIVIGEGNDTYVEYYQASSEPIPIPDLQAHCHLTVRFIGVFLYQAQLNSQFAVSIPGQALRNADASINATCSINLVTGGGLFGGNCAISVQHSLSCTVSKTTGYQSAFTSTVTVFARGGYELELIADLSSTAILDCDFDNIPPTRGEAALTATFTVSANAQSFTDSITLMMSAGTVTCDATLIPPIRATADLTSTATLTAIVGSIEQFASLVMSAGTMTVTASKTTGIILTVTAQAQLTATVKHFKGIILTVTAFNTQLTVGDVINIDPYLTLMITAETRGLRILPENREITIDSETRVNII